MIQGQLFSAAETGLTRASLASADAASSRVLAADPLRPVRLLVPALLTREMNLDNTLILMACSSTKRQSTSGNTLPLLDLYDGPAWQSLRARLSGRRAHIVVLSGGLGIISASAHSKSYEARLTTEKAHELIRAGILQPQYRWGALDRRTLSAGTPLSKLLPPRWVIEQEPWRGVVVCGGDLYRPVFLAMVAQLIQYGAVDSAAPVLITRGGIGEQRSQLGAWIGQLCESARQHDGSTVR